MDYTQTSTPRSAASPAAMLLLLNALIAFDQDMIKADEAVFDAMLSLCRTRKHALAVKQAHRQKILDTLRDQPGDGLDKAIDAIVKKCVGEIGVSDPDDQPDDNDTGHDGIHA